MNSRALFFLSSLLIESLADWIIHSMILMRLKEHPIKYTEKTIFPFPFTLNGIWSWWQFSFQFPFRMELHLVQYRKENCPHDPIPFKLKGNIVVSVHQPCSFRATFKETPFPHSILSRFWSTRTQMIENVLLHHIVKKSLCFI